MQLKNIQQNKMKQGNLWELAKGLFKENPTFCLVLGLCPTLAVSTSLDNAIGMGAAATFVLLGSNIMISAIRKKTPDQIRMPIFIVVIADIIIFEPNKTKVAAAP